MGVVACYGGVAPIRGRCPRLRADAPAGRRLWGLLHVTGAVACYGGVVPLRGRCPIASVLTNATNNDANPTGTFTGFGTIGGIATALCTNLNSWVTSNNANASNPTCLSWVQDETEGIPTALPHHSSSEKK